MADDGTLAPDPSRLARAHRAGLRPMSPWLWPAATCLGLGLVIHVSGVARVAAWRDIWAAGLAGIEPTRLLERTIGELWTLLAWTGGLALVVAWLTGSIGAVDRTAADGLDVGPRRSALRGLLALLVPVVAVVLVASVCAGAARSVDASAAGLNGLWLAWLDGLFFGTGGLLLVAGVLDRALARRRLWRALHRSVAEARAQRGRA